MSKQYFISRECLDGQFSRIAIDVEADHWDRAQSLLLNEGFAAGVVLTYLGCLAPQPSDRVRHWRVATQGMLPDFSPPSRPPTLGIMELTGRFYWHGVQRDIDQHYYVELHPDQFLISADRLDDDGNEIMAKAFRYLVRHQWIVGANYKSDGQERCRLDWEKYIGVHVHQRKTLPPLPF